MVFSIGARDIFTYAENLSTPSAPGICVHHPEHTEECGGMETDAGDSCTYALNGCPYCVTSWSWVDEQGLLTESDGSWGLGLPGVSESDPLTRDVLTGMLPTQLTAQTGSGESLPLQLDWDLSSIPEEGASSGTYTVTAVLADPNYSLTEEAAPLSVTIQLGGAQTYTEIPSGDPPFSSHLVNGVSPNGTTIDLFDYWITSQTAADDSNGSGTDFINQGINTNHALLFGNSLGSNYNNKNGAAWFGNWNTWTENESPRSGIVQTKLGADGYPVLSVSVDRASYLSDRNGSESLAYLFNPKVTSDGKASYENVRGLLQVDSDGYYYYNSQDNYAAYYPDSNTFALYKYPGIIPGGQSPVGQFFPFNKATSNAETIRYNDKQYILMNGVSSIDSSLNHYFGVHMSTRFIQQYDGHTDSTRKQAVTYEFSGDDDVWIFIDGVLVADLGGIHNAATVNIDFSTGIIKINNVPQPQKLGRLLGLNSNTLTNNTYHTLDFFYLERGNVDSNMNLKYNLVTIPESNLIKIDQLGDPVPGAEFTLYAANDTSYTTPIATGTTDADGEFVFVDKEGFPITIQKLFDVYKRIGQGETDSDLVLVETKTPAGYRCGKEIGLYFYESQEGEVLLLSNSVWTEGAYAMPKVTATTPNVIRSADDPYKTVTLTGAGAVENPLMFAVVYQKQTDSEGQTVWRPVSGDPLNGWTVEPDSTWTSVLKAATANPYVFQLASSGAYQVEINNLPGDIKTYYYICKNEEAAEYTIGYYYTTAPTLRDATADNTWRIDSDPTDGGDEYALERVFSMDLYVTNIKNRLLVQKVDELGKTVNGAVFSLYTAENVNVADDGTVTLNPNAVAYDTVTTQDVTTPVKLSGAGVFPSDGHVLEIGEYYLVETSAPGGYLANDTITHVIVDETGVYADAGKANDGTSVLRGVGSIMRSLLQFAADDDVDTTLNSIKASLATNVTYENGEFKWNEASWGDDPAKVLHLQFANANSMLDYGLYGTAGPGTLDQLTFETEEGWSKLLIRQCFQHDASVDSSLKTDLGTMDLTELFSGTVTVRVVNERTGNLKISKLVSGDNAPAGQEFTFQVTVTDGDVPVSGTYSTKTAAGEGSITFVNGTATVKLMDNQSLTILGLPTNATYTVEETSVAGYSPSVNVTGDNTAKTDKAKVTGTIPHNTSDDAATVTYTNTFDGSTILALQGKKTLQGRPLTEDDTFSFILKPGDDTTTQAAVQAGDVVLPTQTTVSVIGNGTQDSLEFLFQTITFKKAGTYQFLIKEQLPSGVTADAPVSGDIWYDTHTATVTVTVTENPATHILSAQADYDNIGALSQTDASETQKAAFTNSWANLTLNKTVTGDMGDRDYGFRFQITMKDSSGLPLNGSYRYTGSVLQGVTGVTAPADGNLVFTDGVATIDLKHGQSITVFKKSITLEM